MDRELILLLGSNIQPEVHIPGAICSIKAFFPILSTSSTWVTHPEGGEGENYQNIAIEIRTYQPFEDLKFHTLRTIEASFGRVRGADKNAPRTLDIDVILDDDQVMDEKLWQYAFIAVPVAQLRPSLRSPILGQSLHQYAEGLKKISWMMELPAYPID